MKNLVRGCHRVPDFSFRKSSVTGWNVLNSKIALFMAMSIAAAVAAIAYAAMLYWWKYPERDMMTDALNKVKSRLGMRTDA